MSNSIKPIVLSIIIFYRSIKGILGFSRERIAALITDIKSRRKDCATFGFPPEHPRSSITDDVECFFSEVFF